MTRHRLTPLVSLALGLPMASRLAEAHPPSHVPPVGMVMERSPTEPFRTTCRQGLRALGSTQGQSRVLGVPPWGRSLAPSSGSTSVVRENRATRLIM
jgi:hypothetical protein